MIDSGDLRNVTAKRDLAVSETKQKILAAADFRRFDDYEFAARIRTKLCTRAFYLLDLLNEFECAGR